MKTRADYYALHDELDAIERAHGGIYLADQCIDREDIDQSLAEGSDEYWNALYRSACYGAACRAEELGLDINALIGRIIY